MSNPRSKGSSSGSAQVLPDVRLEVDFFQAAGFSEGWAASLSSSLTGRVFVVRLEEFHSDIVPCAAVHPLARREQERSERRWHIEIARTERLRIRQNPVPQPMGIRPKFDLSGEDNGPEQGNRPGSRGRKTSGF